MVMQRFVIEREIPGIGSMSAAELCGAARVSNQALSELAPLVQWDHSYVAANKTFCVYLAQDEDAVLAHAAKSGFPANKITLISTMIDPTTANV